MGSNENGGVGGKRSIDSINMEDNGNGSLSNPERILKKNRLSCFEHLHQSIINSNLEKEENTKEKCKIFSLVIHNSDGGWSCNEVMDYVREEIGESALLVNDFRESETDFQVKLKFKTEEQRSEVFEKLKLQQEEGKLCVDTDGNDSDSDKGSDSNPSIPNKEVKTEECKPSMSIDVWDVNPNTLYGLKEEFLRSLDITPPLINWVLVTNFRCDKTELKEVLELAGHVVACSVITVGKRYANAMYSHPLEAIQAISMLNGQTFYGQALKIKMDSTSEYWKVLPKGLAHLGPGLGKYGKPVRDVTRQYERFLSGKPTQIETKIFITDKSTDLLKEITQPSVSRPESGVGYAPDMSMDMSDGKTKYTSPKNLETDKQSEHSDRDLETDALYIHNRPVTNPSSPISKYPSCDSLTDSVSLPEQTESEPKDAPTNMNVNENAENNIPVQINSRFNVGPNQQINNVGPNLGANDPVTSVRPFNSPLSTTPRNFVPMVQGQGCTGVQGMQGAFGLGQVSMPMGPISRPMGVQNLVRPIQQQGTIQGMRPMHPSGPGNSMFGSNHMPHPVYLRLNQTAPQTSLGPIQRPQSLGQFRPQMLNSNVPTNMMQAPLMRPNVTPRPVGYMQPHQQPIRRLEIYRGINAFSLKLINIPPSIKLGVLCDKLSEFGQVTGLEFVSPGCASVKFALVDEAERCFRNYRQVFQY